MWTPWAKRTQLLRAKTAEAARVSEEARSHYLQVEATAGKIEPALRELLKRKELNHISDGLSQTYFRRRF